MDIRPMCLLLVPYSCGITFQVYIHTLDMYFDFGTIQVVSRWAAEDPLLINSDLWWWRQRGAKRLKPEVAGGPG
jgi:hypothetical protein